MAEVLAQAGIESVTPNQLLASSIGLALAVFLFTAAISRAFTIAIAFAVFASLAPVSLVRYRQRKRRTELRDLWPEAVDNLASAVRVGLSLPEALTQLGLRGHSAGAAVLVVEGSECRHARLICDRSGSHPARVLGVELPGGQRAGRRGECAFRPSG